MHGIQLLWITFEFKVTLFYFYRCAFSGGLVTIREFEDPELRRLATALPYLSYIVGQPQLQRNIWGTIRDGRHGQKIIQYNSSQ